METPFGISPSPIGKRRTTRRVWHWRLGHVSCVSLMWILLKLATRTSYHRWVPYTVITITKSHNTWVTGNKIIMVHTKSLASQKLTAPLVDPELGEHRQRRCDFYIPAFCGWIFFFALLGALFLVPSNCHIKIWLSWSSKHFTKIQEQQKTISSKFTRFFKTKIDSNILCPVSNSSFSHPIGVVNPEVGELGEKIHINGLPTFLKAVQKPDRLGW